MTAMRSRRPSKESSARGELAAFAFAAFAVLCCAGLPLLAALAGSLAAGAVLGVGVGLVVAIMLVGFVVARLRQRARGAGEV